MAKVLMKGTEAIAEAAIQAGCRYFYGYPITPQNEIPEYMSSLLELFEIIARILGLYEQKLNTLKS